MYSLGENLETSLVYNFAELTTRVISLPLRELVTLDLVQVERLFRGSEGQERTRSNTVQTDLHGAFLVFLLRGF